MTLNTKNFSKGLKKSQKETRDFDKSISSLGQNIAGVFSAGAIIAFGQELASLNAKIYNARIAFERFGGQTLFMQELRDSTGGMVDDLHLMQQAIQATNLGLRQSDLPTFFKFATIRAAETGVAVDYLVNSIVSGVGRESRLVLDNLGISLKDLNLEIEQLGSTFTPAAISLISKNFLEARREIDDTTNSVFKLNAQWKNFTQNLAEGVVGDTAAGIIGRLSSGLETINRFFDRDLGEQTVAEELSKITDDTEEWYKWLGFVRNKWLEIGREFDGWASSENNPSNWFRISEAEFFDQQSDQVLKFINNLMKVEGAWDKFIEKYTKKVEPPEVLEPEEGFDPSFGYLEGLRRELELATEAQLKLARTDPEFDVKAEGLRELIAGLKEMIDLYLKGVQATEEMEDATEDLTEQVYNLSEVFAEVAGIAVRSFVDSLLQAIETGDVIGAFASFLTDLGKMLTAYGSALVAFGIAEEVLKYGDPYSKIAAGAVLIAAGVALSAIGGAISKHAGGGGGGYGGGRGSYSSYGGGTGPDMGFDYNREIVMVARGEDLVAVINRQNFRQGVNL